MDTTFVSSVTVSSSAWAQDINDYIYRSAPKWCGTAGGTADAITISAVSTNLAITAYLAGQSYIYKSGASVNTGAMTVAVDGLTTKAIQKNGAAMIAGDHPANKWFRITYDGTAFQIEQIWDSLVGGLLPVASGGTGLASGTSGGVPYYSAAGTLASSAALAANAIVIGGGAGVAPATTTTGTGVVTALGVNVGSAGAFVTNGGALGTPSSGTGTNITGIPQANVTGLTTADSPQFAGINVGHATDTTITRVSAGVIAVEGTTIAILGANTFTGQQNLSTTASQNLSRVTVASHATTADIWTAGHQIDWTGTATTTIFPNAPQAGAERVLICAGACAFTAGANMLIDGVASGNTVTCAANDQVIVRAVSTTQFKLSRIKYDGTAQVVSSVSAASQADQETATSTTTYVSPGRQQYHPSAAKVWLIADAAGTINASYNIASITDSGIGILTVTLTTAFSTANYAMAVYANLTTDVVFIASDLNTLSTTGGFQLRAYLNGTSVLTDPLRYHVICFGDQP